MHGLRCAALQRILEHDLINLGNYMTKMLFMLFSIAVFGIYVCWVPQINAECQSKTKLPCFFFF